MVKPPKDRKTSNKAWNTTKKILANASSTEQEPSPEIMAQFEGSMFLLPEEEFREAANEEYPIEALGADLAKVIYAATKEIKVSPALAAHCALLALSLATHAHFDVVIRKRRVCLSIGLVSIASSGERKSSVYYTLMKGIERFQQALELKYRKRQSGEDIYGNAPNAPELKRIPIIVMTDPPLEAILINLHRGYPSQALSSDEAGTLLGGYAMCKDNILKFGSGLSSVLEGNQITRVRANGESFILRGKRLTLHLMAQPKIIDHLIGDKQLEDQGFLARLLKVRAEDKAGTRFNSPPNIDREKTIQVFNDRIYALISQPLSFNDLGDLETKDVLVNAKAEKLWDDFTNVVEPKQAKGREYHKIKGFASKIRDNVLKLAGLITLYEGKTEIDERAMSGAIELGYFYIQQELNGLSEYHRAKQQNKEQTVLDKIENLGGSVTLDRLSTNMPRNSGLRGKAAEVRAILETLVATGKLVYTHHKLKKNQTWQMADLADSSKPAKSSAISAICQLLGIKK